MQSKKEHTGYNNSSLPHNYGNGAEHLQKLWNFHQNLSIKIQYNFRIVI